MKERIVAAAICFGNRREKFVLTAPHHHQIIRYAVPLLGIKIVNGQQGFITNQDRFVSRAIAARIALAAGQIQKAHPSLMSEQLWSVPDSVFIERTPDDRH